MKEKEMKELNKVNEDRLKQQMTQYIEDTKVDRDQEKRERTDVNDFLAQQEVQEVFNDYNKQLQVMFKFYASQDSKKDQQTFDLQYLRDTLSFKELVRFGYQQNLTPTYLTPEDLVYCYKNVIREMSDAEKSSQDQVDYRKSGMIDFENFKKVIIRIATIAQEKLGVGANEDRLAEKLQNDQTNAEEREEKKQRFKQKQKEQDEAKRTEMEKLREEFQKDQRQRAESTSKVNPKKKVAEDQNKELTEYQRLKREQDSYDLNLAKLDQEEQFFKKWLKQRENRGVNRNSMGATLTGQQSDEELRSQRSTVDSKILLKKDTKKLDQLNKQLDEQKKLKNYKIETKQIRKPLDISIITSKTIEALFQFLDLSQDDNEYDINKRLNRISEVRKSNTLTKSGLHGSREASPAPDQNQNEIQENPKAEDEEQEAFLRE